MPDGLYDRDILAWSEQQAELLRRLERGERVNAEIDWPNLIEEVADVGLSELHSCESLLEQAMLHLIKLRYGPPGPAAHWTSETLGFLGRAQRRFAPSMRQRLDLEGAYRLARRQAEARLRERSRDLPSACPWSLDDLLAPELDVPALIDRLPKQ